MPAPPPPMRQTPEQMPPGVPQVSWDGSQLTITADNSTLADILVAIRARTGADIDVPPTASRERIAARLGPGPARDVIGTLLSWTDFDYVIQASDTDPLGIQSVMLSPRSKSDTAVASAGMGTYGETPRRANQRFSQGNANPAGTTDPGSSTEAPVATAQPAAAEPQPAVVPTSADAAPAPTDAQPTPVESLPTQANLNPVTSGSDLGQSSGGVADRMQTLQNLYQQRKQMIQDARKNPPAN